MVVEARGFWRQVARAAWGPRGQGYRREKSRLKNKQSMNILQNIRHSLQFFCELIFIHTCLCVGVRTPQYTCSSQRAAFGNQFFSFTVYVPGIELRSSALATRPEKAKILCALSHFNDLVRHASAYSMCSLSMHSYRACEVLLWYSCVYAQEHT